jgi:hypothetical protein
MTRTDAISSIATSSPSWAAIAGLLLTALIFPFVLYFFKKNERLHEETKVKISDHSITLGLHEYRLISLEEWRKYQTQGTTVPTPPNNVTVNN